MSKAVKNYMIRDYKDRLGAHEDAVLISIRGLDGNENNQLRAKLSEKDIRLMVIRNALAKHAFAGTGLGALEPLFEGSSTLAFGAESVVDVARELIDFAKEIEGIELRGGVIEGELYAGDDGVKQISKLPTREEAIAILLGSALSPGRNLAGAARGPASMVAGCLKAIEEKLEKGEAIEKVAG